MSLPIVKQVFNVLLIPQGRSRGFGFVQYAEEESAQKAVKEMTDQDLDGKVIRCDIAKDRPRGERGGFNRDSRDRYDRGDRGDRDRGYDRDRGDRYGGERRSYDRDRGDRYGGDRDRSDRGGDRDRGDRHGDRRRDDRGDDY